MIYPVVSAYVPSLSEIVGAGSVKLLGPGNSEIFMPDGDESKMYMFYTGYELPVCTQHMRQAYLES